MINSFKGQYRFLSNFWVEPIMAFGTKVPTTEHAYQAAKCAKVAERCQILNMETPGQAKRMGRTIEMREDWESIKEMVMHTVLRRKFANETVGQLLDVTEDDVLIEGNTWGDQYWGCTQGLAGSHEKHEKTEWCLEGECWLGRNRLGVLLMQVRRELKALRGL